MIGVRGLVLAFLVMEPLSFVCGNDAVTMENGYFRLTANAARIQSLEMDAAGTTRYGQNWVLDMGFEGVTATGRTRLVRHRDALIWRGLAVCVQRIAAEIKPRGLPELLEPGHTLGQSFHVTEGHVTRVEVQLPTWHTSDSGATLTLRREGPTGQEIAHCVLKNVPDNSWQQLDFDPQPPGRYYVELSDPIGTIGWWSARGVTYRDGRGYRDGQVVGYVERSIRVHTAHELGTAEVRMVLQGPGLCLEARIRPNSGASPPVCPLLMKLRWHNEGYDVSSRSVPFFRFFADNMRYMPVQQLKRWKERGGRYELSLDGAKWVEADGTQGWDLRFHGSNLSLSWHLGTDETSLVLTSQPALQEGLVVNQIVLEVLPRENGVPREWPEFVLPRKQDSEEATTFFYERALTYPPVWGPAPWHEWNLLARIWHGGEHLMLLRRNLENYPITGEGYVHTWGSNPGWPFPDNTKYDTRHFDTNARFILACWRYTAWTGDREFLQNQASRIRKAMDYQLTVLRGEEGLIVSASKDVTGRHRGVGNNYWDILPFGHLDAYANVVWYASLEAMAQIEEMLSSWAEGTASQAARPPSFYRRLAEKARRAYNDTFWDEQKSRYVGCIDVDGHIHDYGFTFVNLEAMAYGLADEHKARRIYHWMETQPTSTGVADTYTAWQFAPRANTIHNPMWHPERGKLEEVVQEPWWHFGWHGTAYGDQCQDGGAILYTSFYDLMARCRYLGPDNAWRRWQEILARWRQPDRLCGGPPLYRGEHPQQINPGAVGVDIPFPESGLVPCWLLYALLGVNATSQGLVIAPRLPASVPWVEVRNVSYHGLPLSIRADVHRVTVVCREKAHEFTWIRSLPPGGQAIFRLPLPATES